MGCGASAQKSPAAAPVQPGSAAAASSKPGPELSEGPGPERIEGFSHAKPPRPSFPLRQATRGREWNKLHDAAENGDVAGVRRLVSSFDVDGGDENCWTALLEAAEKGHVAVVEALLAAGASPNVHDEKRWTPVGAACEKGSVPIAKMLIDAGAIVDVQNSDGWTPLMDAAERGNAPLVRYMVDSGSPHVDLNVADKKGWTAFMAACEGGNLECVKYLWKMGSEHKQQDKCRWTALDEAKEKGFKDVVAFMEPVVAAEQQLQKMLSSDEWSVEEAMRYIEGAQLVWCLRSLVAEARERLAQSLVRGVSLADADGDERRERSFDLLVQLGHADKVQQDQVLRENSVRICDQRIRSATGEGNPQKMKWAMSNAVRAKLYPSEDLEPAMTEASARYQETAGLPKEWDVKKMISGLWEGRLLSRTPIEDEILKADLQKLLDECTRKVYTRDRCGGRVPDSLRLTGVVHVQNEQLMAEYNLRKESIRADMQSKAADSGPPPLYGEGVKSNRVVKGIPALDANINEVWLLHGTKQEAAESITTNDFRLDLSGSNAGTLFGSGIYLAEMATKGDEYTQPDDDGVRCILLCRATLGRVNYNDQLAPDPDALTQSCLRGDYHSVLGDREKCRGTYREFVVFDEDQVLPEYMLLYRRVFDAD